MKAYSIPNTQISEIKTSYMVMVEISNGAGLQMAEPGTTIVPIDIQ